MNRDRRRARAALLCAAFACALAGPLAAQQTDDWTAPRYVGDVTFLSVNALLGGLTAGVMQRWRGGGFRDGFTRGAAGGAVAYAGRRLAAEKFYGAGLAGRQVSAVGISVIRNAAEDRPSFERLVFPVGPVHFHVDRSSGTVVSPRLNVTAAAQAITLALQSEARFDVSASVSAGAPVFHAPGRQVVSGGSPVAGIMTFGSIVMSDLPEERLPLTFAHERVHVLQYDFAELVWGEPLEAAILDRFGLTRRVARHVAPGVVAPLARSGLSSLFDIEYSRQPVEIEAAFLGER